MYSGKIRKELTGGTHMGLYGFESEYIANEVIPRLMLGGINELDFMLRWKPDVLVPLDRLPGSVWETGFRGEILYYPITDFGILPRDVLEKLVSAVTERMGAGKRVAIFCSGGRGRTGYVSACVLFKLGKSDDPVTFLRQNYSLGAVETDEQMHEVEWFCHR